MITGITVVQCKPNNIDGIIIHGNVKNSIRDYVILSYSPRYRGNPSFDGFKNTGTYISKNGKFKLISEEAADGAIYSLLFRNTNISFPLFEGVDIALNFDIDDPNETLFCRRHRGSHN